MTVIEWGAVGFNLLYVYLAGRQKIACWPVGIIGVVLSFLVYVPARLYSDALLQVFYLVLSLYGWWTWSVGNVEPSRSAIRRMTGILHVRVISVGAGGGLLLGWFWSHFGAALPVMDGMTTSFSIVTTWLVARRYLENWWYWIVIDSVCIGVYFLRDIPAFIVLFGMYVLLSVWGLRAWQRSLDQGRLARENHDAESMII
ncbi:MAG: nicotinamide mononucleotide transporter [Lewinellaceae bacterium]|nr:nicotinamide mononucleotide transporter [Saprospiraceae bacterium]MCB9314247.1 nicotinamide mononucleotide transporter [Lewinellaceae bacterium]